MDARLSPTATRAAAAFLAAHRRAGTPLDHLPAELVPPTIDDAYRVQLALHAALTDERGPRGGWKIGCTTPVMQAYLGIDTPSAGTLYARTIHHGHGTFPTGRNRLGVECELAVRLGTDLVGPPAHDPSAVRDAVAAVMAAIEIVEDRYVHYPALDAGTLVADDFFGAAAVLGPERTDWHDLDLRTVTATMAINGREVGRGTGRDILGDPLSALTWLAATADDLGAPLRAGHVVLLGSLVQTNWVTAGDEVVIRNDPLGTATASFVAP
ncbi:MAG: fumarylacetoacetate hydrolase family protein [Chloroflexota bacterium]